MSAPTKRYDVVAGRPYTTRDGEEKKHWINVGRGSLWDDGGISIELHAVPVGAWFDGKLNLFEQKEREDSPPRQQRSAQGPKPADRPAAGGGLDDEIPFAPLSKRTHW